MKITIIFLRFFALFPFVILITACDAILFDPVSFDRIEKREMAYIDGGSFLQTGESNSFNHNISSFYLAKYEVTYELWHAVYQWAIENGYIFSNQGSEGNSGAIGATPSNSKYEPVMNISWRDIIVWCNAYSQASKRTPCYKYSGIVIKDSRVSNATACDNVICNWGANGFRLPSEGEWQFAASIKGSTPYNYLSGAITYSNDVSDVNPANGIVDGKDANDIVAVYGQYFNGISWVTTGVTKTAAVGTKMPNQLGLYDISGNAEEWCWDWYDYSYPSSTKTDYRGLDSGTYRAYRYGSFRTFASYCQISRRAPNFPDFHSTDIGFRVARSF